jgi:ribosome-associated protein
MKSMHERERLSYGEYDAAAIAHDIVDAAVDKKASDVTLMDVHLVTTIAEFFVIATGTSDRQLSAIASGVRDRMDLDDVQLLGEEGRPSDGWVLLDFGQVIVHIFGSKERAYYDLERHWKDAPTLLRIQ